MMLWYNVACVVLQLSSLSKLEYEGYALILNKSSGEHKVMCGSDLAQNFIDLDKGRKCPVEKFFQYICG